MGGPPRVGSAQMLATVGSAAIWASEAGCGAVRREVARLANGYDGFLVAGTDDPKASSPSGCKVWISLHALMLITIFALACPSFR